MIRLACCQEACAFLVNMPWRHRDPVQMAFRRWDGEWGRHEAQSMYLSCPGSPPTLESCQGMGGLRAVRMVWMSKADSVVGYLTLKVLMSSNPVLTRCACKSSNGWY